jgi:hypothetical protein
VVVIVWIVNAKANRYFIEKGRSRRKISPGSKILGRIEYKLIDPDRELGSAEKGWTAI